MLWLRVTASASCAVAIVLLLLCRCYCAVAIVLLLLCCCYCAVAIVLLLLADALEAQDWEAKAKREARVFEAKYEEMDYTCEDLAGLKVKHNMDQFTEGNETVLTLKDRSILEYKDGNLVLDRDEDELENIQMREEERRKTIEDRKKGKLEYSAHDEENAEKLLAQYDEEKDYAGEMRIGQAPKSKAESEKAQEAIRARLASSVGGEKKMYSLEYETGKVQNDTMDISEMVTFKKKKKKKKTKKSKKVAFLKEPESYEEHKQDHGLRAMRQAQLAAEAQKEFDLRDQRYLRALAKAEAETEKLLVYDEEELLEDAELRSFVDRARRVTQEQATKAEEKEKEEEEDKEKAPLSVGERQAQELANAIKLKREADLKVKQEPEPEPVATEATSESSGVVLKREGVFTSTTEFCRGLGHMESGQDDDKEKERKAALREQVAKAEAAKKEKQKSKEKAAADGEEGKEGQEEDDEEEEEEEDSFINDEPLASAGMFAALTLAKRRGHVQKYVEQRGRAKDEQLWSKEEDPAPHIKLEHRDDEGNILKPKEAYRHLSHVFHGRPPGAQKREKELKKRRELERATSERFLKSKMSKFAKTTQKAGQAYVVLDKKLTQDEVKAKQEAAAEEARVRAQFTAEKMTKEVDSSKRKRGESGDKRKKKKAKKVGLS
eukprot:g1617.t1